MTLTPNILRAARSLLEWDQETLANKAEVSIATVRKIEQGATNARPVTLRAIEAAFDRAGINILSEDEDGGMGVRFKRRAAEMSELMEKRRDLHSRITGFLTYTGAKTMEPEFAKSAFDEEFDLSNAIDEWASHLAGNDAEDVARCQHAYGFPKELPDAVAADLVKLDDINNEIMDEQDDDMFGVARERGWDGDIETLGAYFNEEGY